MYFSRPEECLGVHNIDKERHKIRDKKQIQTFMFIKYRTVNKVFLWETQIYEGNVHSSKG
jgi:hypothetical protein